MPTSSRGYLSRGIVSAYDEDYDDAIANLKRSLSIRKTSDAYYMLGQVYMNLGQYRDAETSLREAYVWNNNSTVKAMSGLNYLMQEKFAQAWNELEPLKEEKRPTSDGLQILAYYYLNTNKHSEAYETAGRAYRQEFSAARRERLWAEYSLFGGWYHKAIQYFNQSNSLEENFVGYRDRAIAYIRLGQWRSAHDDLTKALRLNPTSSTTLSYLAMTESHLGMKDAASAHIQAAFKHTTFPPIVYVNRASIEFDNRENKSALADTTMALGRDQWLKEGYEMTARVMDNLDDPAAGDANRARAKNMRYHPNI